MRKKINSSSSSSSIKIKYSSSVVCCIRIKGAKQLALYYSARDGWRLVDTVCWKENKNKRPLHISKRLSLIIKRNNNRPYIQPANRNQKGGVATALFESTMAAFRKPRMSGKQFSRLCREFEDAYDEAETDGEDISKIASQLRSARNNFQTIVYANKRVVSKIKKRIREMQKKIVAKEILAQNCLLVMASNNLTRVNCSSKDAIRSVRFGKKRPEKAIDDSKPPDLSFPEELLLAVSTKDCPPERFTELYESALRLNGIDSETVEKWQCTAEATKLAGKDMFGMCPGARLHETEEQRTRKDEEEPAYECRCEHCGFKSWIKNMKTDIKESKDALEDVVEVNEYALKSKRRANTLLKKVRIKKPKKREKRAFDPVFSARKNVLKGDAKLREESRDGKKSRHWSQLESDSSAEDTGSDSDGGRRKLSARQLVRRTRSAQVWQVLGTTLCNDDFPLRIAFLDKSGSMGCDETTYNALMLALHNVLHPTRGTTLTLLMAAPGQTQIILRRPSDPPISNMKLKLGSATWFNEPLIKTLEFVAPLLKDLDFQSFFRKRGEPPVQIIALTDGQDNMSVQRLRKFGPLVQAVKEIKYPGTNDCVYNPQVPFENTQSSAMEDKRCPLWLCWMATGIGGMAMLQGQVLQRLSNGKSAKKTMPREILFIDASTTPIVREQDYPEFSSSEDSDKDENAEDNDENVEDEAYIGDNELPHIKIKDRGPHHQKATKASMVKRRVSRNGAKRQARNIVGFMGKQRQWKAGNRARIKLRGLKNKYGTILQQVKGDDGQAFEVLVEGEQGKRTVPRGSIRGSPGCSKSMLVKIKKETRLERKFSTRDPRNYAGQTTCGIQSRRSCDPIVQSKQALRVVGGVTRDLAVLLLQDQPSKYRRGPDRKPTKLNGKVKPLQAGRVFPLEAAAALFNPEREAVDNVEEVEMMQKVHAMQSEIKVSLHHSSSDGSSSESSSSKSSSSGSDNDDSDDDDSDNDDSDNDSSGSNNENAKMKAKKKAKLKKDNSDGSRKMSPEEKRSRLLKRAMKILGPASLPIPASDRKLAQILCTIGVEFLYWGGTLVFEPQWAKTDGVFLEQLGDFVGIQPQRLQTPGFALGGDRFKRQLENWRDKIERPLADLLKFCLRENVISLSSSEGQPQRVLLNERRREDMRALWRLLDPSLQPRGAMNDSLRVCINHTEMLKPPPMFKVSTKPSPIGLKIRPSSASAASPPIEGRTSMPSIKKKQNASSINNLMLNFNRFGRKK